jgi:thiol:disulfide interchange protein DsbC
MLKKLLLAICVSGFALNARAADNPAVPVVDKAVAPAVDQVVRKAIQELAPGVQVDSIQPAPIRGLYQVIASGRMIYVSADGRYLLKGDLIDLASREDVGDVTWARFRKAELTKVPASQRIVFAPSHPKYTVTVFTDVNCGYCRALHEHIAAFNKAGIAVEYLAWPREGVTTTSGRDTPTYTEMVSVWCAADRKAAFSAAEKGNAPKPTKCVNPVVNQFNLGVRLGVQGTPTIIGADGSELGNYMTPESLLKALQQGSAAGG